MNRLSGASATAILWGESNQDSSYDQPPEVSGIQEREDISSTSGKSSSDGLILTSGPGQKPTEEDDKFRPIVFPLDRKKPRDVFVSLQNWEGVVTNVFTDSFNARLIDLSGGTPDEGAEFPLNDVYEDDLGLIKKGAIFYWSIGYITKTSGQKMRASNIRFRRLPAWTEVEILSAKQEAAKLRDLIGWK